MSSEKQLDAEEDDQFTVAREGISAIDGVEIDITVKDAGAGERDCEKVLMDLTERAGKLAAAFDEETPPAQLEGIPGRYIPMMVVNWESRFNEADSDE